MMQPNSLTFAEHLPRLFRTISLDTGDLYSWGLGTHGTLGHGSTTTVKSPKKVAAISNVKQVFIRSYSTFALNSSGAIYAWGDNADGQLCLGSAPAVVPTPAAVAPVSSVVQVAVGVTHTLLLVGKLLFSSINH